MRSCVALLTALSLTACGTIEHAAQPWLGHSRDELVANWGAPARVTRAAGGGELLEYLDRLPDPPPMGGGGSSPFPVQSAMPQTSASFAPSWGPSRTCTRCRFGLT